jgi:hypothetical protein
MEIGDVHSAPKIPEFPQFFYAFSKVATIFGVTIIQPQV